MKNEAKFRESVARVLGAQHDFPRVAQVRVAYIVLAAPRTGSTMLCSALSASRVAGHPMEYLNARYIDAFRKVRGWWNLDDYLADLASRRTSPNGLFGMKVHPNQMGQRFGAALDDAARFLRSFDRFIRMYRRDTLAQAISHMLAAERRVWNTQDRAAPLYVDRQFHPDDVEKIQENLNFVVNDQNAWQALIDHLRISCIDVAFEDLVANPAGELARVFAYLGLDSSNVAMPTTVPMSAGHETMRSAFIAATRGS